MTQPWQLEICSVISKAFGNAGAILISAEKNIMRQQFQLLIKPSQTLLGLIFS